MEHVSNPANGTTEDVVGEQLPGDSAAGPDVMSPFAAEEQATTNAPEAPSDSTPDEPPRVAREPFPASLPAPSAREPNNVPVGIADSIVMTLLQAQNENMIQHLHRLESQLADHLLTNTSCSRAAFDHLYEEMQAYKKNFLTEAQRPLLLDLMMLYDSIDKLRRNYERTSPVDAVALSQNLDGLQVEAEEILLRVGVERMTATPDKLDISLQRAVSTVPTEHPEEHLLVVEQVRSGFVSGGQPLRKEQVVVKKYSPRTPSSNPAIPDENGAPRSLRPYQRVILPATESPTE